MSDDSASVPDDESAPLLSSLQACWRASEREPFVSAEWWESVRAFLMAAREAEDAPDADEGAESGRAALEATSRWLERHAAERLADPDADPAAQGRSALLARLAARRLRRIARRHAGIRPRDELPFLLAEVREGRNGLRRRKRHGVLEDRAELDRLEDLLTRTDVHLTRAQAERWIDRARSAAVEDAGSARAAFRLARALESAAHRLRLGGDVHEDVTPPDDHEAAAEERADVDTDTSAARMADRCLMARTGLLESVERFLDTLPPAQDLEVLEALVPWLLEELDESRVSAVERADPRVVERLDLLVAFARRVQGWAEAAAGALESPDRRRAARGLARRVRRQLRRARRQADDHALALRLRKVFGSRVVRLWDGLVFWAIVAVLGLLVVDQFRTPDPPGVLGWTAWADAGICGFLIVDFFVRFALCRRRGDFFLRRAWSDLLPSLPFGLLADLEGVEALRSTRSIRLLRMFRVLRVLRPLLRFFRLFLFLTRAMDRLVERNAWLLDRDIVFFGHSRQERTPRTPLDRAAELDHWLGRESARTLAALDDGVQSELLELRCKMLEIERELPDAPPEEDEDSLREAQRRSRQVDAEEVVDTMRSLDDGIVADTVGYEFARDLTSSLRFLRLPLLRRLRFVQYVFGDVARPDPLLTTARLGRVLGDGLAWLMRTMQWFTDLRGTITGTQFLDRLGLHLVQATARPAKRLLLFGAMVALVALLFGLTQWSVLDGISRAVWKFLSGPVLILGLLCLIPLGLGLWLRRIAGRVTDFYDRVAAGQFLALTEVAKEHREDADRHALARAVLLPELGTWNPGEPGEASQEDGDPRTAALAGLLGGCSAGTEPTWEVPESVRRNADVVELFHREFRDGAPFHENDTKVSSMLVGNLALENVRLRRLGLDAREQARVQRANLSAGRSGLTGPRIWFRFITQSIAQKTARAILEYNCHCIPSAERERATDEDLALYEQWLARRRKVSAARRSNDLLEPEGELAAESTSGSLPYRTTFFHALHFLAADPERDRAVGEHFGAEVLAFLQEDRAHLFRDVFGALPMEQLPLERRVLNPFAAYHRYLARGRYLLLPFVAFGLVFRGFRLLVRKTVAIVRDVIHPHDRPLPANEGHADFSVARRKIHRMRRPVAWEAVRLRARFDVEYLGLRIPGTEGLPEDEWVTRDLELLGASQREWREVREWKRRQERRLRILHRFLRDDAASEESGSSRERAGENSAVRALRAALADRPGVPRSTTFERCRAVALAFACDEGRCASLLEARQALHDELDKMPREKRRFGLPPLWPRRVRALAHRHFEAVAGETRAEDRVLHRSFVRHARRHARSLLPHLEALESARAADCEPLEQVAGILLHVAERPSSWTEQLVAVRTVQCLARIDLEHYERLVRELGRYQCEDGAEEDDGTARL